MTFEVNQGQTDTRVDFLARGQGYTLYLTPTEAVFALTPPRVSNKRSGNGRESPRPERTVMRMQLVDSAPDPRVQGLDGLPGKVNYFRGNDSSKWRANVPTFKRVRYTSVYPGVDLIYYGQPQQLEYDFIVAPGADPSTIKLAFAGVEDTTVDARGDLVLNTASGPLRFHRPLVYQMQDGRRRIIKGGYVHRSAHAIGFRVEAYDSTRALIIDPVLSYSTHLGGSASDSGAGIAVDATGAAYVTGTTASLDFPTMNPLPRGQGDDAFVAKLTPDGTALVYATYVGGSEFDRANAIAVDSAGAAYITGLTDSADFPSVRPLPSDFCAPGEGVTSRDSFVAKLAADGSRLIYSTCLGGNQEDHGLAIAVDGSGAGYVGGRTFSCDFPIANAFAPTCQDNTANGASEAFLAKFTPDGASLAYSTYFGGSGHGEVTGVAVDSSGAAYITGSEFVTKLTPDGKALVYSTHLADLSFARGIAIDESGAAYVTGWTFSADFPTVKALQPVYGGSQDAFVVKLPPEGGSFIYATYLGSSGVDGGLGIAVDAAGAAYVTGWTHSSDFPTAFCGPGGSGDAFVTKLSPDGARFEYATKLGGSLTERGEAIAVDLTGAAYVTGFTNSDDFPTKQPLQPPGSSGIIPDTFITKLAGNNLAGSPGSPSIGDSQKDGGGGGGGSIDALLAILLAQLALARALRQRSRLRH